MTSIRWINQTIGSSWKVLVSLLIVLATAAGCSKSKVLIDAENVRSIMTNGTPRTTVLELFGPNAVSTSFAGMEEMRYFFDFTGRSQNVSPRLSLLTLVLSNDVVFGIKDAQMKPLPE